MTPLSAAGGGNPAVAGFARDGLSVAAAVCQESPHPCLLLAMPEGVEAARSASFPAERFPNRDAWEDLRARAREVAASGETASIACGDSGIVHLTPVGVGEASVGVMVWMRCEGSGAAGCAEAERAVAAKSRFLASASHDLRQPFQAMRLFLGVLNGQIKDTPAQRTAHMLGQALSSGEALLNSLLDISTLDAGTVQPKRVVFALDELCARLAAEMRPQAEEKGLQLRTRLLPVHVHSDPVLVQRVLTNFLSNAIRYTRQGGVLLALRRRQRQILVQVWDTGFGIPEDQRNVVFEEFHQLENPERDRSRGLGLGLAIVKRIAKLLELPVRLRSELGRGSMFSIALPVAPAEDTAQAEEPSESDAKLARKLLVVDDDMLVLESLRATLEAWGCTVMAAEDMAGVYCCLDEGEPDAIVTDLRLRKNLSGFEVIDRVCELLGRSVPAVVLTGETGRESLTEGLRRGLVYLHKPIQADQLRSAIKGCLAAADILRDAACGRSSG